MKTATDKSATMLERLRRARKNFGEIVKDSTNPFHKSKYADLNAYLHAVIEPLDAEEITVLQPIEVKQFENGVPGVIVTTRLICPTGESLESSLPILETIEPQKMGAAITYYRRYTLASLLALGAEDDDAEGAKPDAPTQFKAKSPKEFGPNDLKTLKDYLEKNSAKIPKPEYVALKARFSELKAEYLKQQKTETTGEKK
jgi:hypothetical protein